MMKKLPVFLCVLSCILFAEGTIQAANPTPEEKLRQHSEEFRRELVKVTEDVYVAVGFGASNASMIVGKSGLIIVDTTEGTTTAAEVMAAFREVSDKPVKAIIYTHSHRDHISGASVFAGTDEPAVYARENFANELVGGTSIGAILGKRTRRQFGFGLESETERINIGIGKEVGSRGLGAGYVPATVTVGEERYRIEIAGIPVEMVAAPGETDDQMYIWLPQQKVLFPGDNFYKAFPNLYPIRGSRYRDVSKWSDSLDKMRDEKPAYLVPSHTRPVTGSAEVEKALGDYSAAIRYVHDKTVEGINQGLTPDQLAESVVLPDKLASSPYLQEFYGSVPWGVRSVFSGYLGWFDGNPTNLYPLSEVENAQRIVALGGGPEKVLKNLKNAVKTRDYQWALQLSDYLIAFPYRVDEVTAIKVTALKGISKLQVNAPARNYYLSVAKELNTD